MITAGKSLTL